MSNQLPNTSPPSNLPPQGAYAEQAVPGNYAEAMAAKKKSGPSFPLGFSAGGGLLIGIALGLVLISGGGDAGEAIASIDDNKADVVAATDETEEAAETEPKESEDEPAENEGEDTPKGDEAVGAAATDADPPKEEPEAALPVPTEVKDPVVPVPEPVPEPEPEPEPIDALLSFNITPVEALALVSITVDGAPASTDSIALQIEAGKTSRRVKVVAKAEGYATFRRTFILKGNAEMPIRLRKPSKKGKGKGKPGGLIVL